MKKLLMFSAAALALSSPALAEEGKDGKPHHQGMMEKLDTDKNGSVSKAEFLAFHEARFAEIDTNSDGTISKEESDAKKAEWKEKRKGMHKGETTPPADAPAETPPAAPAE
ncbi:MAG TPA: EF-hand domain-containing protein [Alphaproteobacteria bacterium]|jgi:hypothetical protein|nr:EF-hand domain-containing protein [Micavibrio sp.]MBK9562824.1 EF-hand domain-containing protein [Micavibrio sp.]HQX28257.1 EF-hand domain-containing protein [Alphaproteobacteria bacterium]